MALLCEAAPWGTRVIRVEEQPEPDSFAVNVRRRGERFLATNPPEPIRFAGREYWRYAAGELYEAYDGICAYTCHKIAPITGWSSVEHFVPKSVTPRLAYEWSNFRLVCGRLNSRKGIHRDVLDPFQIENGVFCLDFPSLQIRPADGCSEQLAARAKRTIERLKLNDETCIRGRRAYVDPYCRGRFDLEYLREEAPFIYREIVRQNLVAPRICEVMTIPGDVAEHA